MSSAVGPAVHDYYEALQVSSNADSHTIERVFRHLAKVFHPDNAETGDSERFNLLVESARVLTDPESRARYDARYELLRQREWQLLDRESAEDDVEMDRRIRLGILSLLYSARRRDVRDPGLGTFELERMLSCPEIHMQFHVWYLKENGWIERLDNGQYAITVAGVDKLVETDLPWRGRGPRALPERSTAATPHASEDDDVGIRAGRDEPSPDVQMASAHAGS